MGKSVEPQVISVANKRRAK